MEKKITRLVVSAVLLFILAYVFQIAFMIYEDHDYEELFQNDELTIYCHKKVPELSYWIPVLGYLPYLRTIEFDADLIICSSRPIKNGENTLLNGICMKYILETRLEYVLGIDWKTIEIIHKGQDILVYAHFAFSPEKGKVEILKLPQIDSNVFFVN